MLEKAKELINNISASVPLVIEKMVGQESAGLVWRAVQQAAARLSDNEVQEIAKGNKMTRATFLKTLVLEKLKESSEEVVVSFVENAKVAKGTVARILLNNVFEKAFLEKHSVRAEQIENEIVEGNQARALELVTLINENKKDFEGLIEVLIKNEQATDPKERGGDTYPFPVLHLQSKMREFAKADGNLKKAGGIWADGIDINVFAAECRKTFLADVKYDPDAGRK